MRKATRAQVGSSRGTGMGTGTGRRGLVRESLGGARSGSVRAWAWVLALGAGALSTGCGGEADREKLATYCARDPGARLCSGIDTTQATADFFREFEGAWKSPCAGGGSTPQTFTIDTWTFRKNFTFRRVRSFFVDNACAVPLFTFFHEGSLRAEKSTGAFDYLLDIVHETSTLTPTSEAGATALLQGNACKSVSWEKAKSVDLAVCSYVYKIGETDQEDFSFSGLETFAGMKKVEGGVAFGDEGTFLYVPRSADRPKALKATVVYAKETP